MSSSYEHRDSGRPVDRLRIAMWHPDICRDSGCDDAVDGRKRGVKLADQRVEVIFEAKKSRWQNCYCTVQYVLRVLQAGHESPTECSASVITVT